MSSPRMAKTAMPKSCTRLAATSSWVLSGLEAIRHEVGAAGLEGAGQVGGLGGDVQAGRHAQAGERLLLGEAFADAGQDRHVAVGPEDAFLAVRRRA